MVSDNTIGKSGKADYINYNGSPEYCIDNYKLAFFIFEMIQLDRLKPVAIAR
jgi:hypothetical protein